MLGKVKDILRPIVTAILGKNFFHNRAKRKASKLLLKYGKEALMNFSEVTKDYKVSYWMEFGSLLGAYRNSGFIKHDDDLDLAMYSSAVSAEFLNSLMQHGFTINNIFVTENYSEAQIPMKYKGLIVDIYLFNPKKDSNQSYCCIFHPEASMNWESALRENKFCVAEMNFKIDGVIEWPFEDRVVSVPSNIEENLKSIYGDNFMTPDPNYNKRPACATYFSFDEKRGKTISVKTYLKYLLNL